MDVVAVGVTGPQPSVAVADPSAASIAAVVGLHERVNVVPVAVITGAIVSSVQLIVLVTAVAILPQASVAFHVLVWVRAQPLLVIIDVDTVGVTGPQASVALAVPKAKSIAPAVGLHPRLALLAVDPVAVITGAMVSRVQLIVLVTAAAILPQASVAFQVLI